MSFLGDDPAEFVEDSVVVNVTDVVELLRKSGYALVPQSWIIEIESARLILSLVSRKATSEEWRAHGLRDITGDMAAHQLLEAVMSDDFVCGYDLAEEFENSSESKDEIVSDGLPRPQRYGERRCQNVLRAHWEDEDAPRSSYPVFEGVTKDCPDSHGLNDDTSNYHDHCIRWMERLTIRRALMGRNPGSWQLVKPSQPSPPDAPLLRVVGQPPADPPHTTSPQAP